MMTMTRLLVLLHKDMQPINILFNTLGIKYILYRCLHTYIFE
jgi:hypothetical protein